MPLQSVQKTKTTATKTAGKCKHHFYFIFNITNIQATVKVKTKIHYCSSDHIS
jgi:hypothetical protein